MTCEDCVHADMCRFYTEELAKAKGITLGKDIFEYFSSGDVCEDFKDRSRFVELPCKVGDTLFVPTRNFVSEYKIVSFHVCGEGIWYRTNIVKGILTRLISDNVEIIGKTVFLTREEAEQALKLKERENDAE